MTKDYVTVLLFTIYYHPAINLIKSKKNKNPSKPKKKLPENVCWIFFESKAVYIKYVGGRAEGIYKFFKNYIVDQGTVELNISWSSNFSDKIFHVLPLNFSFSFKSWLLTVVVF